MLQRPRRVDGLGDRLGPHDGDEVVHDLAGDGQHVLAQQAVDGLVSVAVELLADAFNLGIAFGAWAGGHIVASLGIMHTTWIGALIVLAAWLLTTWSGMLDRRAGHDPQTPTTRPVSVH